MAIGVALTEARLGTVQGTPGDIATEIVLNQMRHRRAQCGLDSFVYTGMALATVASQLQVTVATGHAIIQGWYVEIPSTETVTGLVASATNYIFLQLNLTSGRVTSTSWVTNTTGAVPADSVCVGRAVTNTTQATSVENAAQPRQGAGSGEYSGNAATDRLIFLGWQPREVSIMQAGGVGHHDGPILAGGYGKLSGTPNNTNDGRPDLHALGFVVSGSSVGTTNTTANSPKTFIARC